MDIYQFKSFNICISIFINSEQRLNFHTKAYTLGNYLNYVIRGLYLV